MKIVQLQYDTYSAGRAALRLHSAFLTASVDSSLLSLHSSINNNFIHQLDRKAKITARTDEKIQAIVRKNVKPERGMFSYPVLGTNVSQLKIVKDADIIYLHWVLHGFLTLKNIEQIIALGKPVIFFMHDMWTITGGCHYSFDCEKYKVHCNNCPMFTKATLFDWASLEFKTKFRIFSSYNNVYFVSPSKWLYECTQQSALTMEKPSFHIPNVLNRNIFKPISKNAAKQILGIDLNEIVIAFGAVSVTSPYKGWPYLKQAIEALKVELPTTNISVLIFGSESDSLIEESIPFKVKFMGILRDEYSTALVYNAADIFIAPSLADNLPYTIFESLSCGTPVVAFNTGGIPDMVIHKKNGYLAEYKNSTDLVNGIKYILENNISGYLPESFDTDIIINKHLDLFKYISLHS